MILHLLAVGAQFQFQFIFLNSTAYNFIKLLNERLTKLQECKVITES